MAMDETLRLTKSLEHCQSNLNALFEDLDADSSVRIMLKKLHQYYLRHFWEAKNIPQKKALLTEYQCLVETMKDVKEGNINSADGIQNIKQLSSNRKMDVLMDNILKVCELLFWITAAITACAFGITVGLPIMPFNQFAGIAVIIGVGVLLLESSVRAFQSFNQFKSLKDIEKQEKMELQALSFFAPPEQKEPGIADYDEEAEIEMCYQAAY